MGRNMSKESFRRSVDESVMNEAVISEPATDWVPHTLTDRKLAKGAFVFIGDHLLKNNKHHSGIATVKEISDDGMTGIGKCLVKGCSYAADVNSEDIVRRG